MVKILFTSEIDETINTIVVLLDETLELNPKYARLDVNYDKIITRTIANKENFCGKIDKTKLLNIVDQRGIVKNILLVGLGDVTKLDEFGAEKIGGKIFNTLNGLKTDKALLLGADNYDSITSEMLTANIASGALLASYKFDKYQTIKKEEEKTLLELLIVSPEVEAAEMVFEEKKAVIQGVFTARDYISEPPNVLYPASYASKIEEDLENLEIDIEILGEREMKNLGMGALLGVGQGSQNESQLVVMSYKGTDEDMKPIALVGKGVTFDSGGISLKPANNMWDMKYDMAGSATVVGVIKALASRNAKVNVIGVIGLVENMPSGNAQRPSDIVTTMSGKTAEVLNTDAEGRLVLADALHYAQEKFSPSCIIDIATLTGAISVALGNVYAGCFSNDDDLAEKLIEAGKKVGENLWRMPLNSEYDEMLKSDIADVANISNASGAGSSTAAHFLNRFIKEGMQWAHLDIAGVAWEKKGKAICPKGAVGYGVRLLNKFIRDNYEV